MPDLPSDVVFAFWATLGSLIGGYFFVLHASLQSEKPVTLWLDVYLGGLVGGVVGARVLFVLFHAEQFVKQPTVALEIGYDGLAWQGAVIGAALGAMVITKWRNADLNQALKSGLFAAPLILMAILWAGRSLGMVAGSALNDIDDRPGWMVSFLGGLDGTTQAHYDLQLLGIGLSLLVFGWVVALNWRTTASNRTAWLGWASLAAVILVLSILAQNDTRRALNIASSVAFMTLCIIQAYRKQPPERHAS